jgi:putative transposase
VNYHPKTIVSNLVSGLKGLSSRMIHQETYSTIRNKLTGGALLSPSYFAGSRGGASLSDIRPSVEPQQTPG